MGESRASRRRFLASLSACPLAGAIGGASLADDRDDLPRRRFELMRDRIAPAGLRLFTATATDPSGNTSAFSPAISPA